MESVKIEKLLDAYFEGATSLSDENVLMAYFTSEKVAENLVQYKSIFVGLKAAKQIRSEKEIDLPANDLKSSRTWWYSIAAMLIIALGVTGFYLSQPQYTKEEKEAIAAFEKSKEAMIFLSENLNKGAGQISIVEQFTITKDKIFD